MTGDCSKVPLAGSICDLDTLDTRFTTPSTIPYQTVVDARGHDQQKQQQQQQQQQQQFQGQPSKWRTSEFYFYGVFLAFIIPYMFWVAHDASKPTNPQYYNYQRYLSPGWIPNRKIDVSDSQYHTFRSNLPYMAALLILHPLGRRMYNVFATGISPVVLSSAEASSANRLTQRTSFDAVFAVIFLTVLHGVSVLKIMVILYLNYQIATTLPRHLIPAVTWVFNIALLFANEMCDGYRFGDIAAFVTGVDDPSLLADVHNGFGDLVAWGRWLDSFGGIMKRWEVLFNVTVLRLISYNMDYYWSLDKQSYSALEKKQLDPAALSERDRISIPARPADYNFRNYLAYTIYAPLYLAGPILPFNDYISQSRYRSATIEPTRTLRYGLRLLFTLLATEVLLHYVYVQAISKASPVWSAYSASQLSMLSYYNLHFIWLKLLLPWRLFRLWALIDGIDPPENMIRCVSNNYSTLSFWRSWHRSYNRWLTRYLYIPLGGARFNQGPLATVRSIFNYVLVFTFVALWHDIKLRLLVWGWLVVLFMLPEMVARSAFGSPTSKRWQGRQTMYRMLACCGAVLNLLMMMTANLVGFAVGVEGVKEILKQIVRDWSGLGFLAAAYVALFVGIQVMFELREAEKRRGIVLKC